MNDFSGVNIPGSDFGLGCLPTEERQEMERA